MKYILNDDVLLSLSTKEMFFNGIVKRYFENSQHKTTTMRTSF